MRNLKVCALRPWLRLECCFGSYCSCSTVCNGMPLRGQKRKCRAGVYSRLCETIEQEKMITAVVRSRCRSQSFEYLYQSPAFPLSPTELVPPNTLHTDRPYISSSTWVQAAPACSGFVSPYAVIVRYANWGPRGWPCPAGVGGDPPFPSMYTSPLRRRPLCSLGRSEPYRPHNRRASNCGRRVP